MSCVQQAAFMNQRSFGPPPIGSALGGGFYAGQISTTGNGVATHNLIVGPLSTAQSTLQWKSVNTSTSGTSSDIDGPANSAAMNNSTHPAAQFCEGLTVGGFSDWYMPARNELEVMYFNLKPGTINNLQNSGINPNAVPSRASNYTLSTPAQTSATIFRTGGSEPFAALRYWCSTESAATTAWAQEFYNGGQYSANPKNGSYRVRAVRRVAA